MVSSQRDRRILFVLGSLTVGGTETQLALLAERLKQRGWSVDVLPVEKAGAAGRAARTAPAYRVDDGGYEHAGTRMSRMASLVACEARLFWLILRSRPDVVHGFLPLTNFMGALTGRMAFAPLVVTSKRALGKHQDRRPGWKWLDRIANAVRTSSPPIRMPWPPIPQRATDTTLRASSSFPNGVDFARFDRSDPHAR